MSNRTDILTGIQGFAGANHEIAAQRLYGKNVSLEYIATFEELFKALREHTVGRAVVAFSNTTTESGFIPAPWKEMKLRGTDYWLTDKTEVLVRHHLLALPGVSLEDIVSIHSMGVAFEQCEQTLHGLRDKLAPDSQIVYEDDTALSARDVRDSGDRTRAAVATPQAGALYGLETIVADIQDDKRNTTSFYSWSLREEGLARMTGNENKTLMFVRSPNSDVAGALTEVTRAFSDQEVNLADFHSVSMPGSGTREKQFFIEADAGYMSDSMQRTLEALSKVGCSYDVLGSWVDTIETPLVLDQSTL